MRMTYGSFARTSDAALGPTREGARAGFTAFVSLPVSDPVYSSFMLP